MEISRDVISVVFRGGKIFTDFLRGQKYKNYPSPKMTSLEITQIRGQLKV